MFEGIKKYRSDKFVIIRKEKVLCNEALRRYPNLPWSTFNYQVKTTLDGSENYSLAFKYKDLYFDFNDYCIYPKFDGFKCNVGDVVVTEEQQLMNSLNFVEYKKKISCFEAICLYNKLTTREQIKIQKSFTKALKKIKSYR